MTNTPMTSREAFEAWYQSNFATPVSFSRWSVNSNCYGDEIIQGNWETWQASQAQQAQTIAELVEALEYIEGWSHQLIKENKSRMVNDLIFVRARQAIAKVKGK